MNRLQKKYQEEIVKKLQKEFKHDNVMAVTNIKKIVVNMGIHDEQHKDKAVENIKEQFKVITGQTPVVRPAKKAIAGFGIRQGEPVGLMVTLRGQYMWEFLDKLISIVLPRFKDFQGISRKAFDSAGNYSLGIDEQIVFPEIEYDTIDRIRSLQLTIVTTTNNTQESLRLLELLGMPFEKEEK